MSGMGGLIELVLAGLVLGWGFYELRGLRRDKQRAEDKARMSSRGAAGEPGSRDNAGP